jgi:hypothetical protein
MARRLIAAGAAQAAPPVPTPLGRPQRPRTGTRGDAAGAVHTQAGIPPGCPISPAAPTPIRQRQRTCCGKACERQGQHASVSRRRCWSGVDWRAARQGCGSCASGARCRGPARLSRCQVGRACDEFVGGPPLPAVSGSSVGLSRAVWLWMVHSAWLMVKEWEHVKRRIVPGSSRDRSGEPTGTSADNGSAAGSPGRCRRSISARR